MADDFIADFVAGLSERGFTIMVNGTAK